MIDIILKARKDGAIEFAQWICLKRFEPDASSMWVLNAHEEDEMYYTIEQLYELFLKEKS